MILRDVLLVISVPWIHSDLSLTNALYQWHFCILLSTRDPPHMVHLLWEEGAQVTLSIALLKIFSNRNINSDARDVMILSHTIYMS